MESKNSNDTLYDSVNSLVEQIKNLQHSVQENEQAVNSFDNGAEEFVLMRNFMRSEVREVSDNFNNLVDFVNSIFIYKTEIAKDEQEITTWLMSEKYKVLEFYNKLVGDAEQLKEMFNTLTSEKQVLLYGNMELATVVNEMKQNLNGISIRKNESENTCKDLAEKLEKSYQKSSELRQLVNELKAKSNMQIIEMENCEKHFNETCCKAKIDMSNTYKQQMDTIRSEISDMEEAWTMERSNLQNTLDELQKNIKSSETNLQEQLNASKIEIEKLTRESDQCEHNNNQIREKYTESFNMNTQLEEELVQLEQRVKQVNLDKMQKRSDHQYQLNKHKKMYAAEKMQLQMIVNGLEDKLKLKNRDVERRRRSRSTKISSSQVSSSSQMNVDNIDVITSPEESLHDDKKLLPRQTGYGFYSQGR